MAYRVPRRFIQPPEEPPPYGLFALSFVGHCFFFVMAFAISTYLGQAERSKIYIVNLVPAVSPPAGSPTPRLIERPGPRRDVPRPAPPTPKVEEAPPVTKKTSRIEPPPREIPKLEKSEPVTPVRQPELTLPRRVEKETPALQTPGTRERLTERTPLPPRPSPPAPPIRVPDSPRVVPPAPPLAPTLPVVAARPGVDPMRLGQPVPGPTTTGSISLDVSDFPYTYYLRLIRDKISERWANPRLAVAGGERVTVLFEIGRDGELMKEPRIEASSGNALYDQAAVRAVSEAKPFPPLPPEFKAPSLRVHFGFEYRPDEG